jgi:methionine synthase II (cobalamin-independent)
MDAVSDEVSDVDSAGVYFVSVDEFEHREQCDGALESPPDERPKKARSHDNGSQPTLRRFRGHSTEVSSS